MRGLAAIALLLAWCSPLSAETVTYSGAASAVGTTQERVQLTRFGIRNQGASFGLAGGDSGLASLEFPGDGSVVVGLTRAYQRGTAVVHIEGTITPLPVGQNDSHHVEFAMPTVGQNDVLIVVIDAVAGAGP